MVAGVDNYFFSMNTTDEIVSIQNKRGKDKHLGFLTTRLTIMVNEN